MSIFGVVERYSTPTRVELLQATAGMLLVLLTVARMISSEGPPSKGVHVTICTRQELFEGTQYGVCLRNGIDALVWKTLKSFCIF